MLPKYNKRESFVTCSLSNFFSREVNNTSISGFPQPSTQDTFKQISNKLFNKNLNPSSKILHLKSSKSHFLNLNSFRD